MQSFHHFGLPLPAVEENLYRVSKEAWLLNQVSVPEGILSPLGKKILLPQAQAIQAALQSRYPGVKLVQTRRPKKFTFIRNNRPLFSAWNDEAKTVLPLLPEPIPITLTDALEFLQSHPKLHQSPLALDFLDTVLKSLPLARRTQLKRKYPCIQTILRG